MTVRPISPDGLVELLVRRIDALPGTVRVAIDGPPATDPPAWAAALVDPLRVRGRATEIVRADTFWRDRSLRLEYGHEDVEAYRRWLDADALRREVLDAAVDGWFLPSLRDPRTDRSTREQRRALLPGSVIVVCGAFLLDLPFDLTVALTMSPAALRRRTPEDRHWTLPAFDHHSADGFTADVVVKLDDPRRPAVVLGG